MKRPYLVLMACATLAYLAALPFVAMMAMMSVMASDSGISPAVVAFICVMFAWPLAVVLAVVLAWLFWAKCRPRAMFVAMAVPLLWPLGLALFFALG